MRGLNHQIGSSSMALVTESVDVLTTFKQLMSRAHQKSRQALCTVLHGGHELYRARTDTRLYQQCLLCGYETTGWTIDRSRSTAAPRELTAVECGQSAPGALNQSLGRVAVFLRLIAPGIGGPLVGWNWPLPVADSNAHHDYACREEQPRERR